MLKLMFSSILLISLQFRIAAKDQWVFLGDSLTVGTIGDGKKFEQETRSRWGVDIDVINKSKRGKHTYEYKSEIKGILSDHPRARYFVIFCGVNDVLQYNSSSAGQIRAWLTYVLDAIKNDGRVPILMRMTYRNYKGSDPLKPFNTHVYDPLIKKYSPKWYDFENNRGLLDTHGFIKSNAAKYLSSDGVHLTSQGYNAFRRSLLLEKMLDRVYILISDLSSTGQDYYLDMMSDVITQQG